MYTNTLPAYLEIGFTRGIALITFFYLH